MMKVRFPWNYLVNYPRSCGICVLQDWAKTYELASNRTREFLFNTTGWSPEILSDTLTTSYLAYATALTGYDPTYLLDSLLQKAIKDPSCMSSKLSDYLMA